MGIIIGDCLEKMREMDACSVDAIVTDPPYGWRFMGKAWDGADIVAKQKRNYTKKTFVEQDGKVRNRTETSTPIAMAAGEYDISCEGNHAFQKFSEEWAREALRVLKPGGHMLVFCGPRTYHRMASGVEDAGFEVRDQLQWLFGSGFPKSLDISKAIDKAAGAEREGPGSKRSTPAEGRASALGAPRANHHPTVKPIKLMSYLIRLITPPGGLVLDPFAGSGSTGVAALKDGFRFIGIEREAEYAEIARKRLDNAVV